jgi:hypothetical protein
MISTFPLRLCDKIDTSFLVTSFSMVSLSYVSAYIASSGCNPEANFFSLMALRALLRNN